MEKIILKPRKQKNKFLTKISEIFNDKKKRYLITFAVVVPFIAAIVVFSLFAIKEAKSLLSLVTGEKEVNEAYIIRSYDYVLRDDASDLQVEYFTELKNAIEVEDLDDLEIASLVCKNYVADFYTWSNKAGQYDISAMYYVYTPQKETIYIQARDGFYKYLNNYIEEYGKEDLLEVDYVEVTNSKHLTEEYITASEETFNEEFYITCTWTYKQTSSFSTSKYPKKAYFVLVKREGRIEIVEASSSPIELNKVEVSEDED